MHPIQLLSTTLYPTWGPDTLGGSWNLLFNGISEGYHEHRSERN